MSHIITLNIGVSIIEAMKPIAPNKPKLPSPPYVDPNMPKKVDSKSILRPERKPVIRPAIAMCIIPSNRFALFFSFLKVCIGFVRLSIHKLNFNKSPYFNKACHLIKFTFCGFQDRDKYSR